jgi:hypothetical protein
MGSFWGINVGERKRIKADDYGKNYRRNRHMLCPLKFVSVQVCPSHGENRGSSPLGSAININSLDTLSAQGKLISPTFLQQMSEEL